MRVTTHNFISSTSIHVLQLQGGKEPAYGGDIIAYLQPSCKVKSRRIQIKDNLRNRRLLAKPKGRTPELKKCEY